MQARTKLIDRVLPDYSIGEERFNMISHIAGGGLAVAALVLCVIFAALFSDAWGVVGASVYGGTLVILYTMSSIYHGLKPEMPKKVFQVIDHCTIYFLIAGTYTPIALSGLRPNYPFKGFIIFGIVWACCFIAATLTAIDLKKYQKLSMICYVGMGWCVVIYIVPVVKVLGLGGSTFLFTGGAAYTIGAVLYALGKKSKKRYIHSIFHLFVIAGSVLHFFMILFYIFL